METGHRSRECYAGEGEGKSRECHSNGSKGGYNGDAVKGKGRSINAFNSYNHDRYSHQGFLQNSPSQNWAWSAPLFAPQSQVQMQGAPNTQTQDQRQESQQQLISAVLLFGGTWVV